MIGWRERERKYLVRISGGNKASHSCEKTDLKTDGLNELVVFHESIVKSQKSLFFKSAIYCNWLKQWNWWIFKGFL